MCAMCNNSVCVLCVIKESEGNPSAHWGPRGSQEAALEGNCTLGEVFCLREANTGNPLLSLGVEGLKEAEVVLLLNQLSRRHSLELLAKVIAANFSITCIEEEEDVLLLILNSVQLAGTLGISLITEGYTLSQVAN